MSVPRRPRRSIVRRSRRSRSTLTPVKDKRMDRLVEVQIERGMRPYGSMSVELDIIVPVSGSMTATMIRCGRFRIVRLVW